QMIGDGFMVITITPNQGERYQGIVAIEGNSIEESIDAYFRQSEQLPTRLFIRVGEVDGKMSAGGMLLQV
ncbi:Hsp33 family molecular chaperone HslO, partial [Proteus vulgaris]|uniref:Hsp33 family molecular chaperone HslO n=2 Tax=Morganellaceae TaxID=1903414 RepID=UPI00235EC63C